MKHLHVDMISYHTCIMYTSFNLTIKSDACLISTNCPSANGACFVILYGVQLCDVTKNSNLILLVFIIETDSPLDF